MGAPKVYPVAENNESDTLCVVWKAVALGACKAGPNRPRVLCEYRVLPNVGAPENRE